MSKLTADLRMIADRLHLGGEEPEAERVRQAISEIEVLKSALRFAIKEADVWHEDLRGYPCESLNLIRGLAA